MPIKYTKEERMEIARRVYDGEITTAAAAVHYELNPSSVKGHLQLYSGVNGLPPKRKHNSRPANIVKQKGPSLKEYGAMSREELIDALGIFMSQVRSLWNRRWRNTLFFRQEASRILVELLDAAAIQRTVCLLCLSTATQELRSEWMCLKAHTNFCSA